MRVDRFRKGLRLLSIACLIEAAACGLVIGDLPEPTSGPLNPGQGGTDGSSGTGGTSAGSAGNGGIDAGAGSAGQSGSGAEGGASGDAGSSGEGGVGTGGTAGDGGTAGASGAAGQGGTTASGGVTGSSGAAGSGGTLGSAGTSGTGGAGTGGAMCDRDGDMAAPPSCGGLDCDDGNATIKPGQMGWFETARPGGGGSFDYNCNNLEDREFPTATVCVLTDLTNCLTKPEGFLVSTPVCGGKGNWGTCKRGGVANLDCVYSVITVDKVMRCH